MQGQTNAARSPATARSRRARSASTAPAASIAACATSRPPAPAWKWRAKFGIPEDFELVIEHDHFRSACHVIWRTATRLGVEFRDAA